MATFSKAAFDTAKYAAARPTYPRELFDLIFRYHTQGPYALPTHRPDNGYNATRALPKWDAALDLGCGTGQATTELRPFKRVLGADPSEKMIAEARILGHRAHDALTSEGETATSHLSFVQSSAEELSFCADESIDLVISAQAAHWFKWEKLWPEIARILRPDGTVAFWGYSEMRFTRYPSLTPLINAYSQGTDQRDSLGHYWEQPGRRIVDNHLQDIPSAESIVPGKFCNEERVYFTGAHHPSLPDARAVILRKKTTWAGFEAYLQSFSALHTFRTKNPKDVARPEGDVVQRFMGRLKEGIRAADEAAGNVYGNENENENEEEVEIEWPLALVLAKRGFD